MNNSFSSASARPGPSATSARPITVADLDTFEDQALRVLELRRRSSRDYELKLEPPVNRVLRVGRQYFDALEAFYS